jgi:hypothetical protein
MMGEFLVLITNKYPQIENLIYEHFVIVITLTNAHKLRNEFVNKRFSEPARARVWPSSMEHPLLPPIA